MPYISTERREAIFGDSLTDFDQDLKTAGELNYFISFLLIEYTQKKGLSYQTLNDIMGVLEGAKQEFYRRVIIPYETKKIRENGDIFPEEITNSGKSKKRKSKNKSRNIKR